MLPPSVPHCITVAVGTINGLIFYANIIQAAQDTFIPAGDTNPLTVFIAWLDLDLGIETCFFHGLDGYWKTWLQFLFPFYIWAIIILIIYLSRRSKTVVWSFDGNIRYLGPKHIPLFLFALGVLFFLRLLFSVLLLFEQYFQRIGTYTWMLRLKPFFDACCGPLRGNLRYWVGVLLMARGILLLVFGPFNFTNNPSTNMLAVIIVVLLLLMYTSNLPYGHIDMDGGNQFRFGTGLCSKKWYLSLLESLFLCNLALLSAITSAIDKQAAVVYTSVGITFYQFIGIVVSRLHYHPAIIGAKWSLGREAAG